MSRHTSAEILLPGRELAVIALRTQHLAGLVCVDRAVSLHSWVLRRLILIVVFLGVPLVDDHAFALGMARIHREIVARISHESVRDMIWMRRSKVLIHKLGRLPAKVPDGATRIQRLREGIHLRWGKVIICKVLRLLMILESSIVASLLLVCHLGIVLLGRPDRNLLISIVEGIVSLTWRAHHTRCSGIMPVHASGHLSLVR